MRPWVVFVFVSPVALSFGSRALAGSTDAVGGGYADSGLLGEYYANPDFAGEPSFVRREVRIDFDWGGVSPVGGSTAEPYRSFPTDGFSVRWRGRIIPRFSEPYTFVGEADDGIRVKLRAPGTSQWRTLVDRLTQAGPFESEPIALEKGKPYEIEIEYREDSGEARCALRWKSPSTPVEVIDPVTQQAINAASFERYVWADLMKSARYGALGDTVDERGWPTRTGTEIVMGEMAPDDRELSGKYLIRFHGRAEVHQACCNNPVFEADGRQYAGKLPAGAGYDPATNTTSATMTTEGSRAMLFFNRASRDGGGREEGVTEIQLMRPIAPGSEAHHRLDEVVYRPFKMVLQDGFTAVRWLQGANWETERKWAERSLPSSAFFRSALGQENWEYLVMLSNETGRDLYITTPVAADDDYFEQLARLLRYGSDGRKPYARPTRDPKYPPLNSNLRVYVEVGNEIWNWAFEATGVVQRLTAEEADRGSSTWAAINYDGDAGDPQHIRAVRRWHALRTVSCSNAFREVWGDESMGSRVRMLLEYQYDNYQDTATDSFVFLDEYFGNRRGSSVTDPHPVSYYLWGGGAATYYALQNKTGTQTHTVIGDASFESPAIAPNSRTLAPSGSSWSFKGSAGIIRPENDGRIAELENPAKPTSGRQAAFILDDGSFSQRVRFAKPGHYALSFHAAGPHPDIDWPLPFDIYVDDTKISPRDAIDIRVAEGHWSLQAWARSVDSLEGEWGSAVFEVDEPGEYTIRFVGRGGKSYILIDHVRVASVDAILESGFDAGEAQGQVGDRNLANQLRAQAKYARTFGLGVVAYEAGWSLGGDFQQLPIQNWSKLKDDRARAINDRMIELWYESGGFMNAWGVYEFWPEFDLVNAMSYPIMQSIDAASKRLPAEATYGRRLPTTLRTRDADWQHASVGEGDQPWWRRYLPWGDDGQGSQWFSWMLIAPETTHYSVRVRAEGEGSLFVEVDGERIMAVATAEPPLSPAAVPLTKGAHALRIVLVGEVELKGIDIAP